LSSSSLSAGDVEAGEIITTPAGTATLLAAAIVAPEHSAPTIATTCSELTRRSAPLIAMVASMQPVSADGISICCPSSSPPCSLTWVAASCAASKIGGVRLSIGPVKPPRKPILTSALAPAAPATATRVARPRPR
jgi:hypothetical protein